MAIKFNRDDVQAITAFTAMLGGVLAGAADHFELAPSGVRLASAEEYGKIIEMRSNIELIRLKIERDKVLPANDYDLKNMLTQLDQYAKEVAMLKMA